MSRLSDSRLFQFSPAYRPFYYPWAGEEWLAHEKIHWGTWEADLKDDVAQWKSGRITPTEKAHITQILRLFTTTDMVVGDNYCNFFIPVFKNNEVRGMLLSFASREIVHQKAYAMLNDTLGLGEAEYSAFLRYEELAAKVNFMQTGDVETLPGLALTLAQAVCNEGMSLFSAFAMLLNYARFGKMAGMCTIVEWSIRDETKHFGALIRLFRVLLDEHPQLVTDELKRNIYLMFEQAVEMEDRVIDLAYEQGSVEGLAAGDVKRYIRYLADQRLLQMGMRPIFKVKDNPLEWLEWVIGGSTLSNFFEKKVTDYAKGSLTGTWNWGTPPRKQDGDSP